MPFPRWETVSDSKPGVYFIRSRFTQGWTCFARDPVAKRFCSHRRRWVFDRCSRLCRAFPVFILSLTVHDDGYDMVLFIDPTLPGKWSDRQVVLRWCSYFSVCCDESGQRRDPTEQEIQELVLDNERIESWRHRLCRLSTFMQELNGRIARRINRENRAKGGKGGAIWARRYEASPLLDELAVLTAVVNTAMAAVRRQSGNNIRLSSHSTACHCLRRVQSGWEVATEPPDWFEEFSKVLPGLTWEVLWETVALVIAYSISMRLVDRKWIFWRLMDLVCPYVQDVGLWIGEWIKRKDLPRRALGAPDKLAQLASRLGRKCLHLAWLGNGIYKGTANPDQRRRRRNNHNRPPG